MRRFSRFAFVVLPVIWLSAAGPGFSQGLLPPGDFAPGWKAIGKSRTFIEKDLFNHIDGGAELYLEFGFRRVYVQSYMKGESELEFELYEMTEPNAALGIYLMNAGRETPWPEIPARNSSEDAQVVAVKGSFYLKINNFTPGSELRAAMTALAKAALSRLPAGPTGSPLALLPAEGLVPGSGRLIRGPVGLQPFFTFGEGDILGFGGKTFAALGQYKGADGAVYNRLVAVYASETETASVLKNLRENHDPYLEPLAGNNPDVLTFSDFQKKYIRVRKNGARIEIVFNAASLEVGNFTSYLRGTLLSLTSESMATAARMTAPPANVCPAGRSPSSRNAKKTP